jgi:hypothetical protein
VGGLYEILLETIDDVDSYDPILYVLAGDCKGSELACNDDSIDRNSRVEVYLSAGEEITIIVDGWTSSVSTALDYRLTITLQSGEPLGSCGWDATQSVPGYYCGGSGADPNGVFAFACPAGLFEGAACSIVGGEGCCDANGNVWYCTTATEPASLHQEVCP